MISNVIVARYFVHRGRKSGFTLVEIMVVVVIIGLIAALVIPNIGGRTKQAQVSSAKTQIASFEQALDLYMLDNGFYPTTDQGLRALVEIPTISPEPNNYPKGGYLKKKSVPKDPWGNEYGYRSPGEHGDYDIFSLGPDGKESDDDINNWESGD